MQEIVNKISAAEKKAMELISQAQEKAAQLKSDAVQRAAKVTEDAEKLVSAKDAEISEKAKLQGEETEKALMGDYEKKCSALKEAGTAKIANAAEYIKQSIM